MSPLLPVRRLADLPELRRDPVDAATLAAAAAILDEVRQGGADALRALSVRFGDLPDPDAPLVLGPTEMAAAYAALPADRQDVLRRVAARIEAFAALQLGALVPQRLPLPGGWAGLRYAPVERAGCYAPGGRFPLPSSVLMTAITARVAGVREVWVASPRPALETLAAAHVAGADHFLVVGGAQAIAALAYGAGPVPAVDCIVGPGNRWVTAAKALVAGRVSIDMLAGPSELVVLADGDADAACVAADLLAQAEHDPDALPILVTDSDALVARVEAELHLQLATLPTAPIAREALRNGYVVRVADLAEGRIACDRLAPEHLAVHTRDPIVDAEGLRHYGALFLGEGAAEVLGDYGAGPNHVLPTGGTARSTGALSVTTFLRVQTSLYLTPGAPEARALAADSVLLARMEGLEAHARAAALRAGEG
jgi:phosphoribosyl-ATP pyrophosphohydrolase/phosphoribosyl-AMP cyclohydrolase/histidinol dehydrogenase